MSRLARLLSRLRDDEGTALHISAGQPIRLRVQGRLIKIDDPPLSSDEIDAEVRAVADDAVWKRLQTGNSADFPCQLAGHRYRALCFSHDGGRALVLRATANLSTFSELGLPGTVTRLAHLRRGLILVSGPAASGKSTTISALLNEIEEGRPKHVITIESPIELAYNYKRTTVSQREVGTHTESFATGLEAALRQGGDVLFTSDIPDSTTLELVFDAVSSGMLVVATLRASGVVRAIERLVDQPSRRHAMLNGLAEHLSAVISLVRMQRADSAGHCVATEIMVRSRAVVTALRTDQLASLPEIMEASETMQTMDDALGQLLELRRVAFEDAYDHARDKERFRELRPGGRRSRRARHDDA